MEATSPPTAAVSSTSPPQRRIRSWEGLVLGLFCGGVVWALVQAVHPLFRVPEKYHIAGIGAPVAQHVAFRREQDRVDQWHAMVYLADLGLLLGGVLGMRAKMVHRTWLAMALAAPLGAAGGAMGGYLASGFYVVVRDKVGHADLLQIVEGQLMLGVPLGLLVALGVGVACGGLRGAIRGLLLGAAGGGLFGLLYPLVVAVLLPTANTEVLLPEEAVTRLVWLAMLGGSVGFLTASAICKATIARVTP